MRMLVERRVELIGLRLVLLGSDGVNSGVKGIVCRLGGLLAHILKGWGWLIVPVLIAALAGIIRR